MSAALREPTRVRVEALRPGDVVVNALGDPERVETVELTWWKFVVVETDHGRWLVERGRPCVLVGSAR